MFKIWEEKTADGVGHYTVDISCITRVIQGIKRVPPTCLTNANKLHRLWVHECCRVWGDRLASSEDHVWFLKHLDEISMTRYKQNLDQYLFASSLGSADYSNLPNIHFSNLQSINSSEIVYDEVKFAVKDHFAQILIKIVLFSLG